jgi:cytochrome b pre-mRNA-processing protein 3
MHAPDTVIGRFEMITIHLVLVSAPHGGRPVPLFMGLAQEVLEAFFEDVDHSIRELGIGDTGVPKRMKKFARMFYGRANSYGEALEAADQTALAEALSRNIYPDAGDSRTLNAGAWPKLDDAELQAALQTGQGRRHWLRACWSSRRHQAG